MIIDDDDDLVSDIERLTHKDIRSSDSISNTLIGEGFPLYSKMARIDKKEFDKLISNFSYVIEDKYNGVYDKTKLYIVEEWWKNASINNITDLFTEDCRIKCSTKNNITPLEYWEKNKDRLLKVTYGIMALREMLYFATELCDNFQITVILTILKLFKAKKWIDISAGWGNQLIAAIGHNIDYYFSTDPNLCLRGKYDSIIETLAYEKDRQKFVISNIGFEEVLIPLNKKFDICFSSPPIYDEKSYYLDSDDSIGKYKSIEEWYKRFLIYSIKKAANVLVTGGHMILRAEKYGSKNKINGVDFETKLISDVSKFLKYKGIIYYYYPESKSRPIPIYVWKKMYDENPNFIVQQYENVDIIRDDILDAGTKQRAIINIIGKLVKKFDAFVIPITEKSIDGLTLAYACRLFNRSAHIFVKDVTNMDQNIKFRIEKYGGIIHSDFKSMDDLNRNIDIFSSDRNMYKFNSGFESELFIKTLTKKLKFTLGTTFVYKWLTKYDEVWVADDTGGISKVLNNIFINSNIYAVKVGDTALESIGLRYNIVDASNIKDNIKPPFSASEHYGEKSWSAMINSDLSNKKVLFWNTL